MATELKVRKAMTDAGLYREGTKAELKGQYINEEEIEIAGKSYTLSKIAYLDSKIFTDEMDTILARQNPLIHDIFARNAVTMFDAVRMVNVQSHQGFRGMQASGNELDFTLLMARQFQNPDVAIPNPRTSWVRTIAGAGALWFFEDDTTGVAHGTENTMGEEEGMVWLAFYNPAAQTCIDSFQITMNSEAFDIQDLDFEHVHLQTGDVIIEFKEPWILPPEQSGKVQTYYYQAGTDETRPLGIWIKMARNLRALGTP